MVVLEPLVAGVAPAPAEAVPARRRRRVPLTVVVPGAFLAGLAVVAIFAPELAPHNPYTGSLADRLLGFGSPGHLLGTDGEGRDVLSRLMWGAGPTLLEGMLPVALSGCIGGALGLVAGLSGRTVHTLVMRTLDVFYAFPSVLLAIAVAAALGTGETSTIVALTVVMIAPIARIVVTEVLRIRHADFMDAATASGASRPAIVVRHVVPCVAPALIVYCTTLVGLAIIIAGGLSFLGLGVAPPHPEWGAMLNDLQTDLYDKPVLTLVPAVAILVTSVAFNVLGDGLRTLLDSREIDG